MAYRFSKRSWAALSGVRPELIGIATVALGLSPVDFAIIEGLRTRARQTELVASGASQTMRSRHITGHAIDVAAWVDGELRWDWPLYERIAAAFKQAATVLGVPIEWGGDWESFRDGPHFQLPWGAYPE